MVVVKTDMLKWRRVHGDCVVQVEFAPLDYCITHGHGRRGLIFVL